MKVNGQLHSSADLFPVSPFIEVWVCHGRDRVFMRKEKFLTPVGKRTPDRLIFVIIFVIFVVVIVIIIIISTTTTSLCISGYEKHRCFSTNRIDLIML
jgi:hypothetical protein